MSSRSNLKLFSLPMVIALVLILGGGFCAYMVQTGGGDIDIRDVRFLGANGTLMSGLLYVPDGVDAEHKAPGILAIHGYINSRETQDGFAIEFARRGYVVLALDQTGHGYSDPPAFANGYGGIDGLKYLRSLDIVDLD
ncbi:MAG: alpha/beta hydrolase, partial [Deltaproteobacteria bacterium]|nr:alpha/beta hydrolase [Deltaproteobacteria bacterium]